MERGREDIVEIAGLPRAAGADAAAPGSPAAPVPRPFLSVWYRCCHAYGRLYRNAAGTAYEGRCPRCARSARAAIGPGGTAQRAFEAW